MRQLAILLFLGISFSLEAQTNLSNLEAPTSPASSIIDLQPSATLTPKTYRALETALYSNFLDSNGGLAIPNDFALEFTPYWSKDHNLSLYDYLYPKNLLAQMWRTSSFSLASTQNFELGNGATSSATAFGYRTTLYLSNSHDKRTVKDYREKLMGNKSLGTRVAAVANNLDGNDAITNNSEFLTALKAQLSTDFVKDSICENKAEAIELLKDLFQNESSLPLYTQNSPDAFLDAITNLVDDKMEGEALFTEFESYILKRHGWSIDLATATFLSYPDPDNNNLSYLPKWSAWVTPTYRLKDKLNDIQIHGVLRYERYNTDYYNEYFAGSDIYKTNLDLGLAASFDAKNVTGKFETVFRGSDLFSDNQNIDWQFLGSLNYTITDQIVLTYTFGNKFDPILNNNGNRVSMLTANFGFLGASKEKHLDLTK